MKTLKGKEGGERRKEEEENENKEKHSVNEL